MSDACEVSEIMLHGLGTSSLKTIFLKMIVTPPVMYFGLATTSAKGFHQKCFARCSWGPYLSTTRHLPGKVFSAWLVFDGIRCAATRGGVNLLRMGAPAWDRTALGDGAIQTCPCVYFVSDH